MSSISDSRQAPQISTMTVVSSVVGMFTARLGSLNALEQTNNSPIWRRMLGELPASADTVGRVTAKIISDSIRLANRRLYSTCKRNKALLPPVHGLIALAIDGHESSCSSHKWCEQCLERNTHANGIQYYHRNVTAQLIFKNFTWLVDAEPQLPGEGELTAAKRLYERIVKMYPRAFDVVVADALYGTLPFIRQVLDSGKDIIAVLKANAGAVLDQANHILDQTLPTIIVENRVQKELRETDEVAFGINQTIRVIRSTERTAGDLDAKPTTWLWLTSLNRVRASTPTVVQLGHDRWKIENQGFNETTNRWSSDHVYKHDAGAILNFWLLCMVSFNTFMCFLFRNLKPIVRLQYTMQHIAKIIQSELYLEPAPVKPP